MPNASDLLRSQCKLISVVLPKTWNLQHLLSRVYTCLHWPSFHFYRNHCIPFYFVAIYRICASIPPNIHPINQSTHEPINRSISQIKYRSKQQINESNNQWINQSSPPPHHHHLFFALESILKVTMKQSSLLQPRGCCIIRRVPSVVLSCDLGYSSNPPVMACTIDLLQIVGSFSLAYAGYIYI